ncbi:MAG TPA: hypothetical protein DET40_24800 [Lentisphaeria bacterium]|nr:MAG: hypothetical protein A2X45_01205 [Lentisphaerae bacterium GWF2_50_93]HCE46780.1 hypothetical protein [Lentisphaeria bacterium]
MDSPGLQFAMLIREALLPLGGAFCVLGWLMRAKHVKSDISDGFRIIVYFLCIAALISYYPDISLKARKIFEGVSVKVNQDIDVMLQNAVVNVRIEGEDSVANPVPTLARYVYNTLFWISYLIRKIAVLVQMVVIYLLIAVSPLILSFLAVPNLEGTGVKFLVTTLSITMWSIGFNLADLAVISGWQLISVLIAEYAIGGTLSGGVTVAAAVAIGATAGQVAVVGILAALALAWYFFLGICIFYCGGPMLLSLLLKGGDVEGAAIKLGTMYGVFSGSMFQRAPAITAAGDSTRSMVKPNEAPAAKSLQNISTQLGAMMSSLPANMGSSGGMGGANSQLKVPLGIDGRPISGFANPIRTQNGGIQQPIPRPVKPGGSR